MGNSSARKIQTQSTFESSDFSREFLSSEDQFILTLSPRRNIENMGAALISWAVNNQQLVNKYLTSHGGILFQGFNLTQAEFKKFSDLLYPETGMLDYKGGTAPREKVEDGLYLATAAPKEIILPMHHELANLPRSPAKIFFYCATPAEKGGETPLCSNRKFMEMIDKKIIERFKQKRVLYRRCLPKDYIPGVSVGWVRSYESSNKAEVEAHCKREGIQITWKPNEVLVGVHVGQGVATHPHTKEELWYNIAYGHNRSSGIPGVLTPSYVRGVEKFLKPEVLDQMRRLPADELPSNTLYGDGKYIEPSVLTEIDGFYQDHSKTFQWKTGDFVLIDNMLTSHGRNSFEGPDRRILVTWKY